MPIVPTSTAPTVAPAELPGAQWQTPTRFLAESQVPGEQMSKFGAGMMRAGDEMLAEQTRQQINLNEAAGKDYDAKLMGGIQAVLYGTPNTPSSGYLTLKGKDATDAFDTTVGKLQGLGAELSKDLQNPAQQELVKNQTQLRVQAALVQAAQHNTQQNDVYQQAAGQLRIKTAQEGAPLAYNPTTDTPAAAFDHDNPANNSQYQLYLQTVKSEAADLADRKGLTDPDLRDAVVKDALAKAYTLTLSHLIDRKNGNTADLAIAKSYFDSVKSELPVETQDKVKAVIEAGMTKDQGLNLAIDLKGTVGGINKQEEALDGMFKDGKITSDVHDIALQKLRADNSQRRSEQGESDKAMLGTLWDLKNKGGSLADLSPSQYNYVKQRGLGPHADAIFKSDDNQPTDAAILHNLYAHIGDGSPQDIAKLSDADWMQMRSSMSRQDWKHWDEQRTNQIDGIVPPKNDPGNLNLKTFNSALNSRMLSVGVNPAPGAKDKDAKEQVGAVQDYAAKFLISEQQAAGRRFNQDETQKSLDKLFATNIDFRITYLGGLFSGAPSATKMMSMKAKDIPSDAYQGIKKGLIAGGNTNPSDRDVLLQYWSMHGK